MNGLLLVNLGTPEAPTIPAVRRYLREFLSDPRVIDLPALGRWLLLNLIILPFRPKQSAHAYQQIWTERGSPLLLHGRSLESMVQERLGEGWKVVLAMRYGAPSLAEGLAALEAAEVERVVVLPLYPQYASSTTGSTLEALYALAGAGQRVPSLCVVPPFHEDEGYLSTQAALMRETLEREPVDHVLFTFHGLPERQVRAADPTGQHCLAREDCCEQPSPAHRTCYRHQCRRTAEALAGRLDLAEGAWSVAFQSRLGRTPWLGPYTDQVLAELGAKGVERVALVSGSFVADCLETLEELGLRGRETFEAAGGKQLVLVPSLNDQPAWADTVAALARRAAPATD
ncbi:MAG: ferrochelatase [Deltaproteobacteria bacterium]|nr:ferrochelatase [Deltaproteobacteria bacterium]